WRRVGGVSAADGGAASSSSVGLVAALRIPGVREVLVGFFAYCALETTAGLWAGSYLVLHRHMAEAAAAGYTSLVFVGITAGRFLSGLISDRFGDRNMIRGGLALTGAGILLLLLPGMPLRAALIALALVGLGCAPVYPAIIHGTPRNFGAGSSQAVIGIQMAAAYVGSTVMPPLFGFLARHSGVRLYPWYLLVFGVTILLALERMNRIVDSTEITSEPAP
ncbi:MAG: MFS transporter, partial [Bacteroidales bacterium]|nr:MFS transporter [Bacteroidales bacterium]